MLRMLAKHPDFERVDRLQRALAATINASVHAFTAGMADARRLNEIDAIQFELEALVECGGVPTTKLPDRPWHEEALEMADDG